MAQLDDPVLAYDDLMRTTRATREALVGAGLLAPYRTARSVTCDACAEGHVEQVETVTRPNSVTQLFIYCPEYGRIEVEPDRLRQWFPDYRRVAPLLSEALECTGAPQELVPNRLWNLGRTAIARQSRPVWLVRRISDELRPRLPTDRVSLLFVMGIMPRAPLDIASERVFEVRHLVRVEDGGLCFDADAVQGQLGEVVRTTPKARKRRKRAPRADATAAVKKVLRDQALMRKSVWKKNWGAALPPLTQKEVAEAAGVSQPTLSRILNDDSGDRDREAQLLWRILNDPEDLMRYHG